jgi:hypothetical protein
MSKSYTSTVVYPDGHTITQTYPDIGKIGAWRNELLGSYSITFRVEDFESFEYDGADATVSFKEATFVYRTPKQMPYGSALQKIYVSQNGVGKWDAYAVKEGGSIVDISASTGRLKPSSPSGKQFSDPAAAFYAIQTAIKDTIEYGNAALAKSAAARADAKLREGIAEQREAAAQERDWYQLKAPEVKPYIVPRGRDIQVQNVVITWSALENWANFIARNSK